MILIDYVKDNSFCVFFGTLQFYTAYAYSCSHHSVKISLNFILLLDKTKNCHLINNSLCGVYNLYIYIYIYIYIYLIEHKRHFLSTYFFVNPFKLPY